MKRRNYYLEIVGAAFPELKVKLGLFWGNQEFIDLMHDLQHDTRGNTRKGFPLDVLDALYELEQLHYDAFPHIQFGDGGRWKLTGR